MPIRDVLAAFDPRRSLRARFALVLGASGLALALGASLLIEGYQRRQIEASVGQSLHLHGQLLVRALSATLHERVALVRQLASQPLLASGLVEPGDARGLLEQLHASQPEFAWIGMLDARGEVLVATNALLQGESYAEAPAFRQAQHEAWIGQRHAAGRLARFMPLTRDGEPPQYIDLGVPLIDFQGRFFGVLVAELDWSWVVANHATLLGQGARTQGVDSLLAGRAGTLDIAPASMLGQAPPMALTALVAAGPRPPVLRWPDGRDYLTAAVTEPPPPGAPDAGFTLLVRQDVEQAYAAARALQRRLLAAGTVAVLTFMLLSAWLAGRVARPLQRLSAVAARRRLGEPVVFPPAPPGRADEVVRLAETLRTMDAEVHRRAVRYQTLFEGSLDAMYVRVNGRVEMANQACLVLFGATSLEQLQGLTGAQMFHPDERERIADRVHRLTVLREAVPLIEQRLVRLDGRLVDVEVTALPFDDEGRAGIQVVLRDITERKRARLALQRSEERFQLALSGAQASIWEWDPASNEFYFSPNWPAQMGYGADDHPTTLQGWMALMHPDDRVRREQAFHDLMDGRLERIEGQVRMRHRDGHVVQLLSRAFLVPAGDGRPRRLIGTTLDVTEAARAERRMREKDQLLAQTGRLARLGGWRLWPASGHVAWTDEVAAIFGLPPDAPMDRARLLEPFEVDHRQRLAQALDAALAGQGAFDLELALTDAAATRRWVRVLGRAESGDDATEGEEAQPTLAGVMQDITEQRRAQAEIHALNADLERRVEARTAQLRTANAELDSFAYAVSHDLRAPLRAMSGFAQALEEDNAEQLDEIGRGHLSQIKLASRRMGGLIDGLLTLSRSARGRLQRDRVDLGALARHALDELRAGEPERQVEAVIADGLLVHGDARMLDAAMRNLIGNAWKYSARATNPRIELGLLDIEGTRWFFVRDNGVGFDMAHAARLFKAFQRLHRADEFPGIGIGLATVQRIVRRHGGQIVADARPGQGATFRFTLPERAPDEEDDATTP